MTKFLDLYDKAVELISDEDHWTIGRWGATADHGDVPKSDMKSDEHLYWNIANAPEACRWCVSGAIMKVADNPQDAYDLLAFIELETGLVVLRVNDTATSHECLMKRLADIREKIDVALNI